jgi:hypothetical protein
MKYLRCIVGVLPAFICDILGGLIGLCIAAFKEGYKWGRSL